MNYMKILVCLLHKRQNEQPLIKTKENKHMIETHHIIMRSLGGSNDKLNLVNLTLREHYVMHELLVKVYEGTEYKASAIKAWNGMSRKMPNHIKSSRLYEKFRSKYNQVAGQSTGGKICITNGLKNRYIYPNEKIPDGWHKGMHHTNKGLMNIKQGSKNRIGMIIVTNGIHNKWVWPNNIPVGYKIGSTYQTNKGKIWVNNGQKQIFVKPDEIPPDFKPGQLPMTEQHRQIILNIHKNMSDEKKLIRNAKISKKLKGRKTGRKLSEAHKQALREGQKKVKIVLSIEQRKRISDFQRGKIKVNNGIKTIYADPNNIPEGFVRGQLHKHK